MKPIFALAFALLVLAGGNSYLCAQTDEEVRNHVIVGCRYLIAEQLDKAIAEFDAAISLIKTPKTEHSLAYYNRARAYERKHDFTKAFADYTKAIELDPRYLLAYYGRAYVMQKKGRLDDAILEYKTILGIDMNQAHAHNNSGVCYYEKGEFSLAMSEYNKALEIDPNLLNAHYNRAVLRVNSRDYYEAVFDFDKELKIYPNSLKPKYYRLAISAFNSRIYNESWRAVKKLVALKVEVNRNFLDDLRQASGMASAPETQTPQTQDISVLSSKP